MENISIDDNDNALPDLPEFLNSVGSSVSSTMEDEYNDIIQNTFVVPQFNALTDIKVPKILENTLGLFSTKLLDEIKAERKDIQTVSLEEENQNEEMKTNEQMLEENEIAMTIEKIKANLELLDEDTTDNETSKFDYLKSITSVTDEANSSMMYQKNMEQFLINNYSNNDENPRQNSPVPASPPTNIDIDDTSSLDTIIQNNYPSKSNHQASVLSSTSHDPKPKSLDLNNNNLGNKNPDKNIKIATCLDKWYKELKGHVLSEFEKSRLQMMQEQQKKLIEEKEKQTIEIVKLKKELDLMRETVKSYERKTLKKDIVIENMTKAFEKQCEKNELQKVMMEWKLKRVESARDDFTSKLADKYYNLKLKMKTFLCWHFVLVSRQRLKLEKACKKKAEDVCYDLASKYETKIKKLEEELNNSRAEIDKHKAEMAKNEENMRKALMRGVCALNMEAMSIFNETISNKTIPTTAPTNPNDSIEQQQQNLFYNEQAKHEQEFYSHSSINQERVVKKKPTTNHLNETESQELARRVKNYCETNLNKNQASLSKAKQSILNSNREPQQQQQQFLTINPNVVSHTKLINSCNKIYDELTEHNLPNKVNSKPIVKSKIGSIATPIKSSEPFQTTPSFNLKQTPSSKSASSNLPPQIPAYRSFIIEKHSTINNNNNVLASNTTRVKYAPPGQSATVLNTVISASAR